MQHVFVEPPRGFEPRTYALRAQDDEGHMLGNHCLPTVSESPWSAVSPFAPTCSGLIPGYDSTLAGFRGSAATGHGDLRISHIPAHPPMGTSAFTAQCKHAARSAKTGAAVRAALGFVACECRRPLRPCPMDLRGVRPAPPYPLDFVRVRNLSAYATYIYMGTPPRAPLTFAHLRPAEGFRNASGEQFSVAFAWGQVISSFLP